ncbi:MAG: IPT/TIG domain-containing protein [Myxococcales bacterium]|nr:IPT/TIG domain-containing protein [Myxococcales bacterium]
MNPNAQVTLTGAFRYTSADTVVIGDPPALGAVTPGRGPVAGGTIVRIVGGNFDPALRVFFGDVEATMVQVASASEAAAVAPAGAAAGPVAVKVQNPDGKFATLASGFVYGDPADGGPAVTSTWPTSGPSSGGTWVTVDGQRLTSGSRVWFGMTPAASTRWVSDGRLIAVAPPGAVGTVRVTVVRADGAFAAVADAFAYYDIATLPASPPVVSSVFPGVGTIAGGDAVAVLGSDFEAGTRLYFDAEQVAITESATSTKRGVTTPQHAAGSVAVTAVNPNGLTSTRSGAYVYYAPPPLIIGVAPVVASTSGGSEVTITGKNFVSGTVVELGDATITSFNQRTATALKFFAPTHAAGTLDVVVRNPDGQSDRLVGGFTYVPDDQFSSPVVTSVEPAQGLATGGYIAVVHGQSFAEGAAVTFGGVAATNVQLITPETLTAVVPAGTAGTTVAVKVANSANKIGTLADAFTYTAAPVGPIAIRTVAPGMGSIEGGTVITVTGEGFETGSVVTIGGQESPAVAVISPTVLTAITPAGADAGLVDVQVRRPDFSSATAYNAFAYYDPATYGLEPAVFGTDPVIGPMTGGTAVLITGARFSGPAIVFFGAREATSVTVLDANRIVARTPIATLPGTVAVSVMNADGLVGVMSGGFSYYDATGAAVPVIGGLLPNEGSVFGGDTVTVVGQRMSAATRIYICDRPAAVTGASGSNLSIRTPGGDAGPCRVTAVNSDGLTANLVDGFKYVSPNPHVTDVIPQIGPIAGGIDVVVRGSDFVPGADVRFGNSLSPLVVVADAETLTAKLPAGQLGPVDITVINPGGKSGTLAAGFTYVDSVQGVPPLISAIVPATGPVAGGTPVRVLGTGFSPDALLLFDQVTVTSRQVVSANEIRFTTPPGAGIGSVPITVLNPDGLGATASPGFTYANPVGDPPAITSVVPSTGREAGGTTITITGSGFSAQGTWTLGGKSLENVATVTGSLVTARTPAGTPGKKDLVYVAPDGRVAIRLQAFEYLAAPVLTAVTPALGNKAGGTEVNILGDHFNAAMEVYFGQNRGQVLSVSSESTALVRTPTAPVAGKVDVRVKNPDGQEAVLAQGFEFLDTPTLTGVWPPSGPTSGGTLAWVSGTGFHPQSQVMFGATSATAVHFKSATLLLAFAPSGTVGPVDVKVVNPDGREVFLTAAFIYTDPATLGSAPYIGELFPARGPTTGGTKVSLDGAAFAPGARVAFLPEPAVIDYTSQSRLVVTAPPHPAGTATVWVTNPDGQSIRALEDFTYIDPSLLGTQPVVSNMTPTRGPTAGGTTVTLTGNYFQSGARVRFGPIDGQVTTTSAQQLAVLTPPSPKGGAAVMIVNPDGTQTTAPSAFLFLPPPDILAINPTRVPASGNVSVTISGSDLVSDPDGILPDVLFCTNYSAGTDCVQASQSYLQANSAGTQLSLLAPAHTPALTDVVVRAPDGQIDIAPASFTFSALPAIVSVEPNSGPTAGGTLITLRGQNFQQGAEVRLGTKLCTETVVQDATTVKCKTPAGSAGPIDVILTNADTGGFSLAQGFTYVAPPQIVSMIPNVGPENPTTPIESTITGFNFKQGLEVYIGATLVPAADTTVTGTTTIRVKIPVDGHGSNDVKVVNPDGQFSILLDGFTYIPPLPAPQANFVTPALGTTLGGDEVKVAGQFFLDGVRVYFGTDGAWFEASGCGVRNNGTLITCLSPAHDAGVTDVRVVNTDGQEARLTSVYEFVPPAGTATLKFFSIEPTRSILTGGGRFTISGEGFKNGVTVRFIKNDANQTFGSNIVRLGPTLITGTLPPAPANLPGKVTVRIVNPATAGGPDIVEAVDAFEYVNGPVFVRPPGDRLPNEPHDDVGVVIFDVNGDGLNDVLVFTSSIDRLLINNFEGRKGSFQSFPFAPAAGNFSTVWAIARDFDEDGDIDIIRHRNNATLQFCANEGGGSFPTCVGLQSYGCPMRRFIANDFNCDGHLDLFLPFNSTSTSCQNRLLVGFGTGQFVEAPASTLPALLEETMGAAAADIDKDNDVDLLLANDNNAQSRLYLNNCSNIQETGACAAGIPNFTNLGYNGHAYAFSTTSGGTNIATTATWDDARAYCRRFGYDLVRIDDVDEDTWLRSNGPTTNQNLWIGYRAPAAAPYTYAWTQDGTSTYEHWCQNEPNNQTSNYLCAYYAPSSNPASRCWNDYPCNNGFYFVCEAPKPQCTTGWQFSDAQYGLYSAGKTFPISATNARDALLIDVDNDPDHYPDAIIASWGQPVNVFINQGGRFLPNDFNRWPLNEANPYIDRLVAADIDGDSDVDIVAQAANNEVRIYANQLAQTQFGAFANETPARWPNGDGFDTRTDVVGVAVGDLDDDHYPDVYIAGAQWADRLVMNRGYEEGEPWIDSSRVPIGEFRFNTYRQVPERRYDGRATKFGDLNNDGFIDLVKVGWNEEMKVYFNDGAGKFVEVTDQVLPAEYRYWTGNTQTLKLVDIDADGDLDIFYEGSWHPYSCSPQTVACSGHVELVNEINVTGMFKDVTSTNIPVGALTWAAGMTFDDFDQDGDIDWFLGGYNSSQARMLINGGDVWNVGGRYFFDRPSFLTNPNTNQAVNVYYMYDAVTVNLNNDGYPDLFVGTNGQNVVLLNKGGTWFDNVTVQYANTTSDNTRKLLKADFDQDGDEDLIIINQDQQNRYLSREANDYANITASSFIAGVGDTAVYNDSSRSGDAGDLDLDDDELIDFVVANYGDQNRLWINQGSGQFLHLTQNLPWDQMRSYDVYLIDLDDDGDLDIYWTNEDQDRVYMNTIIP